MKPPEDLKDWSKNDLVREVQRLRAVLYEHAHTEGDAPVIDGGEIVDVAGDPYARGGVILDVRNAILLERVDVSLVDTKRDDETLVLAMLLEGRINYSEKHGQQLYLLNEDGAAAVISELIGLATRIGPEFAKRLDERLAAMPQRG